MRLIELISPHIEKDVEVETGLETYCAFSGQSLTEGVKLKSVIKSATANLLDTFKYPSEYVSVGFAKMFGDARGLRGNLFIDADGIQRPLISADSAIKAERPAWGQLLAAYSQTLHPAVIIVTGESKRRLWVDACVSEGDPIRLFVNNERMSKIVKISVEQFKIISEILHVCLNAGFTKQAIAKTLFLNRNVYLKFGFTETHTLENRLTRYRKTTEFDVALMVTSIPKTPPRPVEEPSQNPFHAIFGGIT